MVGETGQPLQGVHGLEVASQGGVHPRAVDDRPLPVEVHEFLERQRVADEVGRGVLEVLLVPGFDRLAHMGGESGMPPGEEPVHELG